LQSGRWENKTKNLAAGGFEDPHPYSYFYCVFLRLGTKKSAGEGPSAMLPVNNIFLGVDMNTKMFS
jgi:hypothetical protein